jgi:hypothetical protein
MRRGEKQMKIRKIVATGMILGSMIMANIPLLPLELVPEAQAIFGVRRRTAVVAYSAGAASRKAAAPQQAAPAPQPAAPAPSPSAVPIGSVVETLPQKCIAVTVANNQYQDCNNTFYRAAFMGDKLVYVVVDKPI